MKTGRLDLNMEHAFLILGAPTEYRSELLGASTPIGISDSHLVLTVQAQMALVRIDFWSNVEMRAGTVLFDGEIDLPDGRLYVRDVDELVWHRFSFGPPGRQRILVAVDDPGAASRVWIVSSQGHNGDDGRFDGECFGGVAPNARHPSFPELLGYYLADHDSPSDRLSAVILLLAKNCERTGLLRDYYMSQVREWLRRLSPTVTHNDCVRAVERIVVFPTAAATAEASRHLGRSIVDELSGRR
ncbi:hypothetical protein [Dactylosporangium sp. CA-139066]|uniref:hypothetical protein n=1 Tax=Dactylosporangium sp. CA-139066 TaxID=3239930 RepID=UPI003D8F1543